MFADRADVAVISQAGAELTAARRILGLEAEVNIEGRRYFRGEIPCNDGQTLHVVHAFCVDYGNLPVISLVHDVINDWKPRFIILLGTAGGVLGTEDLNLGDVVVSKLVKYYELRKDTLAGIKDRENPVNPPSPELRDAAALASNDWSRAITLPKPDGSKVLPKWVAGTILSGDKIQDNPDSPDLVRLLDRNDNAAAFDMEAGGVARALFDKRGTVPEYLVIRGISDLVNSSSHSETRKLWTPYASEAAAAFTLAVLKNVSLGTRFTTPSSFQREKRGQDQPIDIKKTEEFANVFDKARIVFWVSLLATIYSITALFLFFITSGKVSVFGTGLGYSLVVLVIVYCWSYFFQIEELELLPAWRRLSAVIVVSFAGITGSLGLILLFASLYPITIRFFVLYYWASAFELSSISLFFSLLSFAFTEATFPQYFLGLSTMFPGNPKLNQITISLSLKRFRPFTRLVSNKNVLAILLIALVAGGLAPNLNYSEHFLTPRVSTTTTSQFFYAPYYNVTYIAVVTDNISNYEDRGTWVAPCLTTVYDAFNESVSILTPQTQAYSSNNVSFVIPQTVSHFSTSYFSNSYQTPWQYITLSNPDHLALTPESTNVNWYEIGFSNASRSSRVSFSFVYSTISNDSSVTCSDHGTATRVSNGTAVEHQFIFKNDSKGNATVGSINILEMEGPPLQPNSTAVYLNGAPLQPASNYINDGIFNSYIFPPINPGGQENFTISTVIF